MRRGPIRLPRPALVLGLLLCGPASAQQAPPEPAPPAAAPPRTTVIGSRGPGVYLEDLTYTLRLAPLRTVVISPHDPDVAYAGTRTGYVFKTVDGGRTWDESRLIVEPSSFFGDNKEKLYFGVHRTGGSPPIGMDRISPSKPTDNRNRLKKNKRSSELGDDGGSDRAGAAANVNFGVGLPGRAPRLQLVVRKFGKPTSGLNIKQTLLLRGTRKQEIRMIVIHPRDPDIVFACTAFGLYKTYDGGLNWVRTFTGTRAKGRMAFHVAIDPRDPNKVFLATGEGLYISRDGGENFLKSTQKGVGEGVIDWIYFHPRDPRYVFVGTDYGLLRSSDGGEAWEWIYFTTFPTARVVRHVVIDPFDARRGYIATHDGLFHTDDILDGGLESWKRLGGLQFTGVETTRISACPRHRGHLWALSKIKIASTRKRGLVRAGGAFVWESVDGGRTWRVLYSGNTFGTIEWFENDPADPDLLWLVWSSSLVRMRRRAAPTPDEPGNGVGPLPLPSTTVSMPDMPSLSQVMAAGLRYTGADPGVQLAYRARARWRALVPRLDVQLVHKRWRDYNLEREGTIYRPLPYRELGRRNIQHTELAVMLTWDLAPLMFTLRATPFGRIDRLNHEVRGRVRHQIHYFYSELLRLKVIMANQPPEQLRVRVMYRLRIEELTSLINFVSGGYLARWERGDRPSGFDTRWWEPWVAPRPGGAFD